MFCTKCGAQLPDDAVFCSKCGAKIEADGEASVQQQAAPPAPKLDYANMSIDELKTKVDAGDAEAMFWLGNKYRCNKSIVIPDKEKVVFELYSKSAELGCLKGKLLTAWSHNYGYGTAEDVNKAYDILNPMIDYTIPSNDIDIFYFYACCELYCTVEQRKKYLRNVFSYFQYVSDDYVKHKVWIQKGNTQNLDNKNYDAVDKKACYIEAYNLLKQSTTASFRTPDEEAQLCEWICWECSDANEKIEWLKKGMALPGIKKSTLGCLYYSMHYAVYLLYGESYEKCEPYLIKAYQLGNVDAALNLARNVAMGSTEQKMYIEFVWHNGTDEQRKEVFDSLEDKYECGDEYSSNNYWGWWDFKKQLGAPTKGKKPTVYKTFQYKLDTNSECCFITTAVCQSLNAPDDCKELTAIRGFRDGYLRAESDGDALIKEYYKIGPQIVQKIDNGENPSEEYSMLWEKYIKICYDYIQQGRNAETKQMYIDMVLSLCRKYGVEVSAEFNN